MADALFSLPDPVREADFYRGTAVKRFFAWLIDVGLIAALCVVSLPFTLFLGIFFLGALYFVLGFLYRWATLSRGSATWGQRLMAIELREKTGARFDGKTALLHVLGYTLTWMMTPLVFVSAALMVFGARGQSLTDLVLGSAMINRPAKFV